MSKVDLLKQLAKDLCDTLPKQAGTIKTDVEKSFRAILTKTFEKFDLVTRHEFDVQTKVLARTRKKINELEDHITALEKMLKKKQH